MTRMDRRVVLAFVTAVAGAAVVAGLLARRESDPQAGESSDRRPHAEAPPVALERPAPSLGTTGSPQPALASERADATKPVASGVTVVGAVRTSQGDGVGGAEIVRDLHQDDAARLGVSAPDGSFRVELAAPAALWFTADGFVPFGVMVSTERPPDRLDVRLVRAASIRGVVVGADGEPVAAALTWVDSLADSHHGIAADAHGRFVHRGVAPSASPLHVVASVDGHARGRSASVAPREGESVDVGVVRLTRGATLRARVLGPDGRAATGVDVHVLAFPERGFPYAVVRVGVDRDGRFEIAHLEAGSVHLRLTSPALCPSHVVLRVEADTDLDATLRMREVDRIRGVVLDDLGAPVENAWARTIGGLVGSDEESPSFSPVSARTAADGAFVLEPLPTGTIPIEVHVPGYRFARTRAATGSTVAVRLTRLTDDELRRVLEIESEVQEVRARSGPSRPDGPPHVERLEREKLRILGDPDWETVPLKFDTCGAGKCG
jgi:hypothetical protein